MFFETVKQYIFQTLID